MAEEKKYEMGHEFLARLGKTRLRPGGREATDWLLAHADFTPDTRVLEVACNMGTTMVALAEKHGCRITGLDMDPDALEKARANIEKHGLGGVIDVVEGNAMALPFPDASFDVVINEAMLTMLSRADKAKAAAEYFRVLKPGGVLLTQDVVLRTDDEARALELRTGISRAIRVHVDPLSQTMWEELFRAAGFSVEVRTGDMTLLDPVGLVQDEGFDGAMKIIRNGLHTENIDRFRRMFNFFSDHKKEVAYIAVASRK
ncbi:class I SAM-dependent methyltransferase [Selenomonas sp. TAMA-11512]|uniref:class I SAM-dependent methyltransferase n=1 Tax=Selenomonas sp. TAMA-11512 TaxID=3095337 RepID=UPI00308C6239|nr:class I SAM-dependent methyltransferase [Selenomonas sp. TAMA-11512]